MCYSSYLFKSCHRCRYRNQTVVSKVHTGLMTYENSRVSSRWGNSQGNLQQQVFRRCLHVCEWQYYSERTGVSSNFFFFSFFFVTVVTIIVIKTTIGAPTLSWILFIAPWKIWRRRKKGGRSWEGTISKALDETYTRQSCIQHENGPFESKMRQ